LTATQSAGDGLNAAIGTSRIHGVNVFAAYGKYVLNPKRILDGMDLADLTESLELSLAS
jgi:hypothetical protein